MGIDMEYPPYVIDKLTRAGLSPSQIHKLNCKQIFTPYMDLAIEWECWLYKNKPEFSHYIDVTHPNGQLNNKKECRHAGLGGEFHFLMEDFQRQKERQKKALQT